MSKTNLTKEVVLTCPNKPGTLAKITSALAKGNINIEACCCYAMENEAYFHIVTPDSKKTMELCKKSGWGAKESEVVCTELTNKVGSLAEASNKLAEASIDIDYCYTSTGNGSTTKVILATKDNPKTLKVLS